MTKISIIVPVHNVQEYLSECIESVIQQTYNNFELILVDDGSTDRSGKICDQYSVHYPELIKTLHVQNGGPLRARLTGIKEAVGDVLVFIDSDDSIRKDALEKIAGCFNKYTCDMVLYNAEVCTYFPSLEVIHSLKSGQVFEENSKYELYEKIIRGEIPNCVWLKAVRAECTVSLQRFIQHQIRYGEDLLLSVHFITYCPKIVYLDEGLYHYRKREGSLVNSFNIQINESVKIVHNEIDKYIDEWNLPELMPVHNTRKVKGWMYNLVELQKNRKCMSKIEFKDKLISMSKDTYFRDAYNSMDKSQLSFNNRTLAYCLYNKCFFLITLLFVGKKMAVKIKPRRNYDR